MRYAAPKDLFRVLSKVVEIANSTVTAETKLQNILKYVIHEFGMDLGVIYGLDKEFDNLVIRASSCPVSELPLKTIIPLGNDITGLSAQEKSAKIALGEIFINERDERDDFDTRIAVPILDDTFIYGALIMLSRERAQPTPESMSLLGTICLLLAGTIRHFRVSLEAKKRITERSALFEIGKVISSTMDLQELVDQVVRICAKVVSARGALLSIFDAPKGEAIIKTAFGQRQEETAPPLCVALDFRNGLEGTLCVYEKLSWENGQPIPFDDDDHQLLIALSSFLSSALDKALIFAKMENLVKRNQMLVRRLSTLYDISSAMMMTVDFETLTDVILNELILREGLLFDRAVMFLLSDDGASLRLHKGLVKQPALEEEIIGAGDGSADAERIVELFTVHGGLRDLSLPMDENGGPLVDGLRMKKVTTVTSPVTNVEGDSRKIYDFLGEDFAAVPLMAKDKVIGTLVVDHNGEQRPVNETELRTLAMLAHQAGLALENSRLYAFIDGVNKELREAREKLLETEKMAALGEVAAGIAHEIRNPLVSIGGFTRRVLKKVDDDSPIKEYLLVIIKEVERLEKTLRDVLSFSQDLDSIQFQPNDLILSIEAALSYMRLEFEEGAIIVEKEYADIPKVYGDERQLRHLFFNLFLNSRQAMKQGGVIRVRTYQDIDEEHKSPFVAVEITDSGGGIPSNILQNIFNPFFTSKPQGTGLGLSIAHRIVKRHNGDIEVINHPSEGASFIVKFPAFQFAERPLARAR